MEDVNRITCTMIWLQKSWHQLEIWLVGTLIGQSILSIVMIDKSLLVRPDPTFAFRVCFWNQGLLSVSALGQPGSAQGQLWVHPSRPEADAGQHKKQSKTRALVVVYFLLG